MEARKQSYDEVDLHSPNLPRILGCENRLEQELDEEVVVDIPPREKKVFRLTKGILKSKSMEMARKMRPSVVRECPPMKQEEILFWRLVLLSSLLALSILGCVAIYLSTTDFFQSHQNDLLGSTVDERFTVVSQRETSARIFLKSGYSNIPYAEAVISLDRGVLRIGRASSTSNLQSFYGIKFYSNGTVQYTNEINTPKLMASEVHATRALVFNDGTTMTTAADVSGGLEQQGDLNFASIKGSIVSSAGGFQRLRVNSDGTVVFLDYTAKAPADPSLMGFVFDASKRTMTIGNDFRIFHGDSSSGVGTSKPFQILSDVILLGSNDDTVSLKCPDRQDVSSTTGKATALMIQGQTVFGTGDGGDVIIEGGQSSTIGGVVRINGGKTTAASPTRGNVIIGGDATVGARVNIGSKSLSSSVHLLGPISVNEGVTDPEIKFSVHNHMVVKGSALDVTSQSISLGGIEKTSSLSIDGTAIQIGKSGTSTTLGNTLSTITMFGKEIMLDAPTIQIGNATQDNYNVALQASKVSIDAADKIVFGQRKNTSLTIIKGRAQIGERIAIQVWDDNTNINGQNVFLGSKTTQGLTINAKLFSVSTAEATSPIMKALGENLNISTDSISIGSTDVMSTTSIKVQAASTMIDGISSLSIGAVSPSIYIGKQVSGTVPQAIYMGNQEGTSELNLAANAVKVKSTTVSMEGNAINIGQSALDSGDNEVHIGSTNGKIYLQGELYFNGIKQRRALHSLDAQPHILGTAIQSRGGVVEKRNGEFVFKLDLDQNFQQLKANPRISTLFATTNAKVKMLYFSIEITDVRGIGKSAGMDLLRCILFEEQFNNTGANPIVTSSERIDIEVGDEPVEDIYMTIQGSGIAQVHSNSILGLSCKSRSLSTQQIVYSSAKVSIVEAQA